MPGSPSPLLRRCSIGRQCHSLRHVLIEPIVISLRTQGSGGAVPLVLLAPRELISASQCRTPHTLGDLARALGGLLSGHRPSSSHLMRRVRTPLSQAHLPSHGHAPSPRLGCLPPCFVPTSSPSTLRQFHPPGVLGQPAAASSRVLPQPNHSFKQPAAAVARRTHNRSAVRLRRPVPSCQVLPFLRRGAVVARGGRCLTPLR